MRVIFTSTRVPAAVLAVAQIFNVVTAQAEPAADAQPKAHGKKVEKPVNFIPAVADPLMGDWSGEGSCVAQVLALGDGTYRATLLSGFDTENNLVATLEGSLADGVVTFKGDGWTASIEKSAFKGNKGDKTFALHHVTRTPPTL